MSPSNPHVQAARLLALAIAARERGDEDVADELTKLAMQYLDQIGGDEPSPPLSAPDPGEQPPMQQQQQIQPKDDDDKV